MAVLLVARTTWARWFILPGAYYGDDYGWIISGSVIAENQKNDRAKIDLEYYGGNQGQARIACFVPRSSREWTFCGQYQALKQKDYSAFQASNQEEISATDRRNFEFWARCDFPNAAGAFYGLQAAGRKFFYRGEGQQLLTRNGTPVLSTCAEGEEYCGSLRVGLDRRSDRYDPRRGAYLLFQFDLGNTFSVGKTEALVRARLDLREYFPLFNEKSVLALNLQGGIIHHHVPYFSRFKLGGSQSLRGFPLERYSGNGFYLLRAEYRQIIVEKMSIPLGPLSEAVLGISEFNFSPGFVVFTDAADLWRDDLGWWGFRQGVGVGLRAIIPPGIAAAFDLARPVDGEDLQIYLSLEHSF